MEFIVNVSTIKNLLNSVLFFFFLYDGKEVIVGTKSLPTKPGRGEGGREDEKEEEVAGKEEEADERSWEEIEEDKGKGG